MCGGAQIGGREAGAEAGVYIRTYDIYVSLKSGGEGEQQDIST